MRPFPSALAGLVTAALLFGPAPSLVATPEPVQQVDGGVELASLRVERKAEPVGLDVDRPRFSWMVESSARDVVQEAYRVRVATSEAALAEGETVWDSGEQGSDQSVDVAYDGPRLASATEYVWRVDTTTNAGVDSATSRFRTGLYDEADWAGSSWIGNERVARDDQLDLSGARWIWTPEPNLGSPPAEPRAFRHTLTTPAGKTADRVEVLITADDLFEVWLNGTSLGSTEGRENEWQQSHLYDVDARPARNVVAVRTNNGAGSPAGLIAKVRVTYTDGTTDVVTTGADWSASKSLPAGWQQPGFDDSSWGDAVEIATYGSGPWGSGVRPPADPPAPAPLLRKEFDVTGDVERATVYYAAGAYADVTLNGAPISHDVLTPGFTDYDDTVQYAATDVTDQLDEGTNAIGIELGRGFFGMTGGNVWRWENPPWHDEPMVRSVLHLEYADGTTEDVVTDDSWTIDDGPTVFDDLYAGERYDARLEQDGYDEVGFDDSGWTTASEVDGPSGELVNQRQQPIRVTEELAATDVSEPVDGVFVVTFPRVIAGWTEVTATGPAGTTIEMRHAEKLTSAGRVNLSNNGGFAAGFQTDRFTLAGAGGPETWESRFSYKGFQHVEVHGWPDEAPPPASAFTAKVVHTDAQETGSFESSSPLMNQIHRATVDTLKNNIHGIPTDTPMFEKNGWTGDAAVGAEMFMMNLDTHELFAKWMRDVHETRDENGAPLVIAPSSGDWGQWGVNPPWHSAYVMIPYWLYQYGGDRQVMTEYYDGIKRYVDLEFTRSGDGVVDNPRLGDWVSPEASPAGGNAPEDTRVSATAYLYVMTTTMQQMAELLDKDADAAALADRAATIKAAFNRTFWDQGAGYYRGNGDRGYRQTHNVLAVAFGLTPDEATTTSAVDSIVADVRAKGMHLNTGVLGTKYLLPVLTEHGHEDVAMALATQTSYPSWGFMIENGATSMWEHWALEARSRGHYFLGTVDDWFFHDVAGIEPSPTTGFRDISIAPAVTGQMKAAKATVPTPYGPVTSDWNADGRRLDLDVHVPVGTTATVELPGDNAWAVTEGGRPVAEAEGLHDVSVSDGVVSVVVGSGDYALSSDERLGLVGSAIDAVAPLGDLVGAIREAGAVNPGQGLRLARFADEGQSAAAAAYDALLDGDARRAARELARAHVALEEMIAITERHVKPSHRAELLDALSSARDAVAVAAADVLELAVEATVDGEVLRPGDQAPVTLSVANGGPERVSEVRGSISDLGEGWTVSPREVRLAGQLRPGATAEGRLSVGVPETQRPGTTTGTAEATYRYGGATLALRNPVDVTVQSPVVVESVTADPAAVRPGATTRVTATVRNVGRAPAPGEVRFDLPAGWQAVDPQPLSVAPGETAQATVELAVPRSAQQAVEDVTLTARFTRADDVLATGTGSVRVAISPDVEDALDHVDLGSAASEQAHGLTASPSSGTNTEAGLTRRYAGHLTPFSFFEFDVAVTPGKAFVIRAVETYDRAQTKRYKVYVDGEEVLLRTFARTTGLGTETYEVLVPASLAAADGRVRVRFENQDDAAYYDPSIADVWTRPAN